MSGVDLRWSGVGVELDGIRILDSIDLHVPGGTWLSLLGPNGAGKTTLVRTLTGAVSHEGIISLHGRDLAGSGARDRARDIAVVPQHPIIPHGMDVFAYVLLGRTPHQGLRYNPSLDDRRRTQAVLQRFDLDDLGHRRLDSLSGGERQRVVLARALVQDTPVLVLDEPTAFLDVGHQLEVLELIADLRSERALTVITTLHDLSTAGQFADDVAVLGNGKLVAHGPPVAVLTPELIATYWGVDAAVTIDDYGAVNVTIRRRRESRRSDAPSPAP